ncbi:G-protein coupled receptor 157-like [Mercenaria mercenaria]|uniref:G-protein coupled receptor 157-like n=1 Tax=Mercenaria mercenaria TaxID=6596 RepID=UPI00234EB2BF|nr:G-protein coupled receptor 157-like [Mercenaria mercenaria]
MENNSCLSDCDDVSKNGIPSSEYIYVVLTAVTSGLSIFGGTCICVLYFTFKDLRSPGRQLLLFLAFSDAMLALGNLLGIIWHLYSDSSVINRSEAYCDFQSAMTIYFSMTSFAWTVTMGASLFATVVLNKQSFTVTYMKLFHILAWIPAGTEHLLIYLCVYRENVRNYKNEIPCFKSQSIITIIALGMNVLGTDTTLEQASWCWIDTRVPNVLLWQFITGKCFEIVAYVTTVVLYTAIKIFLARQAKKKIGRVSSRRTRRDVIAEANRKLTFVPLVFIVCRIWGTVRFLIGNFAHDIVNEPSVTWINPLQGIGDSVQGFANFVIYCFSTRSIRRRMFPCSNKVGDITVYGTDNNTVRGVKKNAVGPCSIKPETTTVSADLYKSKVSSDKSPQRINTKYSKYESTFNEKDTTTTQEDTAVKYSEVFSLHAVQSGVTLVTPMETALSTSGVEAGEVNTSCFENETNNNSVERQETKEM